MNNKDSKDYVINLRVSRATYEKIKTKAVENRDTISNLVRKVIEDSGEVMQDLSRDVFGKKQDFREVISYHKVEAAAEMECAQCGKKIGVGDMAVAGETKGGRKYYFCQDCRS